MTVRAAGRVPDTLGTSVTAAQSPGGSHSPPGPGTTGRELTGPGTPDPGRTGSRVTATDATATDSVGQPSRGTAVTAVPGGSGGSGRAGAVANREVALVDLLDRLLAGGVVITGDITLSIADVDLVRISLNAVISSVRASMASPWDR